MKLFKKLYSYEIFWSNEDNQYVAVCHQFESLSWLDDTPQAALQGLINIINNKKGFESIPQNLLNYTCNFFKQKLINIRK
jgi:hypothetical protein